MRRQPLADIADPTERLAARLQRMLDAEAATVAYWGREIERLDRIGSDACLVRATKIRAGKVDPAFAAADLLREELAALRVTV